MLHFNLCSSLLALPIWSLGSQCPLFENLDEQFLDELCLLVVPYLFSPGEMIVNRSESAHEMYLVHRGVCEVRNGQENVKVKIKVIVENSTFQNYSFAVTVFFF